LFPTEENKVTEIFPGPKTQGKSSLVQNLLRGAITLLPTKANEVNEVWTLVFFVTFCSESRGSKKSLTFFENFAARFPEKELEEGRTISDRAAVDFGAGLGARVHGRYPK
jgi:hypothetical protein